MGTAGQVLVEGCREVAMAVVVEQDLQPVVGLLVEFVRVLREHFLPFPAATICLILYHNESRY